jgi:hypothetical protein
MGVSAGMEGSVGEMVWKLGRGARRVGEGVTVPAWELGMGDGRGCWDGRWEVSGELVAGEHRVNHTLFGAHSPLRGEGGDWEGI